MVGTTSTGSYGVYGEGGSDGVKGHSDGYGVEGESTGAAGLYSAGVYGSSENAKGVWGSSTNGVGIYGYSATSYAGFFGGDVLISGTCTGCLAIYFFKGPFARDGVIGFWIPATAFCVWMVSLCVLFFKSIAREERMAV